MLAPPGSALDAILGIGVYLNASTKPPKGRLLFGKRILLLEEHQLEQDAGAMLMHALALALAACVPDLKCRWIYNVRVLKSIQASEEVVASYNVQVLLWDAGEFKWVPVQMQQLCPPEKEGGRIVDCKAEASAALATASPVNHFCSHLRPWGVSPLTQWQSHDDQPHFLVLLWSLSLRSVIWSFLLLWHYGQKVGGKWWHYQALLCNSPGLRKAQILRRVIVETFAIPSPPRPRLICSVCNLLDVSHRMWKVEPQLHLAAASCTTCCTSPSRLSASSPSSSYSSSSSSLSYSSSSSSFSSSSSSASGGCILHKLHLAHLGCPHQGSLGSTRQPANRRRQRPLLRLSLCWWWKPPPALDLDLAWILPLMMKPIPRSNLPPFPGLSLFLQLQRYVGAGIIACK